MSPLALNKPCYLTKLFKIISWWDIDSKIVKKFVIIRFKLESSLYIFKKILVVFLKIKKRDPNHIK